MRRKILTTAIGVVLAAAILIVAVSMVELSGKQTEIWKNGEKDSLTTIGFLRWAQSLIGEVRTRFQ